VRRQRFRDAGRDQPGVPLIGRRGLVSRPVARVAEKSACASHSPRSAAEDARRTAPRLAWLLALSLAAAGCTSDAAPERRDDADTAVAQDASVVDADAETADARADDDNRGPDAVSDERRSDADRDGDAGEDGTDDDSPPALDAEADHAADEEPGDTDATRDPDAPGDEEQNPDASDEPPADANDADGHTACGEPPAAAPPADLPPLAFPPPLGVIWTATSPGQTNGSPGAADLNRDGALDFVAGGGIESRFGNVMAVCGATGDVLWRTELRDEVFTRPVLLDLNADCVADVVVGGRTGVLVALDGRDGATLWQFAESDPRDDGIFNWLTPQPIDDLTGDGVPELLFANGGDARAPPFTVRPPGHLLVIDPVDGAELARAATPDIQESYMSPLVVTRPDGRWVLVGTGGETAEGSLWAVPLHAAVASNTDGAVELVTARTTKGVMAPPSVADLNDDGIEDYVVSTFDARIVAVDGATFAPIWEFSFGRAAESYFSPALVELDGERGVDVFATFTFGVFPRYTGVYRVALRGRDGEVLWAESRGETITTSPLGADVTGDGRDEVFAMAGEFGDAPAGRLLVFEPATYLVHAAPDQPSVAFGAGWLGDVEGDGRLDWVVMAFSGDGLSANWSLTRHDVGARTDAPPRWGGYLGTNGDGR